MNLYHVITNVIENNERMKQHKNEDITTLC